MVPWLITNDGILNYGTGLHPQLVSELRREFLSGVLTGSTISSLVMWGVVFPILLVTLISVAENAGVNYSTSYRLLP